MVAGAEPNAENKLFVGGCPPGSAEEDLRQVFEKHGEVEEIFIMRGGSRSGMACAFIRFATQAMAQAAIDAIHGQVSLPNTAEPLVVRWADAPGSKRRDSHNGRSRRGGGGGNRDNVQQGYPQYMGMQMHPQLNAQMQMQMLPQMGGFGGGYYPQQQMQWAPQQMAQMGYAMQPPLPPSPMMMGGSQPQMVMAPMGDPRVFGGRPGMQQSG